MPWGGDSLILTNLQICDVNPLAVNVVVVNVPTSSGDSLEINLGSRFAEILRERGQSRAKLSLEFYLGTLGFFLTQIFRITTTPDTKALSPDSIKTSFTNII